MFIITAHQAEAKPFLDYFNFVLDDSVGEFWIFRSDEAILGISGQGKRRAFELTELLVSQYALAKARNDWLWLNFGIAGSGSHDLGSLVMADTVIDAAIGNRWKMPNRDLAGISAATLKTVAEPSDEYQRGIICDMESSGILRVLSEHSVVKNALILKLVSDVPDYPFHCVTKQDILTLIDAAKPRLHAVMQALQSARAAENGCIECVFGHRLVDKT